MRERRLGTPAGTVPRRDDTRPDTIGEVVDGRLDPRLHALTCQMIAAEDDVDRLAPERGQRAERCVDDACVRARREHADAPPSYARRNESLVEDQGIPLATVVHMVDARFIPAGGVPANKITSPCH